MATEELPPALEEPADNRAQCQRRSAKLAAAAPVTVSPAPPMPANAPQRSAEQEAERFAAAVEAMPPNVGRFLERKEPVPARRRELEEDRRERD